MHKTLFLFGLILVSISSVGQNFEDLVFGNDSTLDIVTWNIEWFPKNGLTTVNYVAEIIDAIDADVIAFQEIDENFYFEDVIEMLPNYDGFVVDDDWSGLAYAYKNDLVTMNALYEIYPTFNNEFPRPPLVMEFTFMEEEYTIINNHLKCCGDGNLDIIDEWDEETRRLQACLLLEERIENYHNDQNVIVLGDFNDLLAEDNPLNNVFENFINDPSNYAFTDIDIAEGTSLNWSYPWWPSHLDHILITSELFDEMEGDLSISTTIRLDDYFSGGLNEYDDDVSDHRPVGLRLQPENVIISVEEEEFSSGELAIFPNPNNGDFQLQWSGVKSLERVEIINSFGQLVFSKAVNNASELEQINVTHLTNGMYIAVLKTDKTCFKKEFVIIK